MIEKFCQQEKKCKRPVRTRVHSPPPRLKHGVAANDERHHRASGGNDTAAIQNALNSAPAGQTVNLTAGTYHVSSALNMNGHVLAGVAGQTTLQWTGGIQQFPGHIPAPIPSSKASPSPARASN